ncbi:MAG: Coenzyme F420 hydrogenase/dehydrogenase, beta subunit C-terminal domain [Desulfitobacteriaceae bacterium]
MLEIINNLDNCLGCSACKAICPVACIEMRPSDEGFLQPCVDGERCIDCNKCALICPALNSDSVQSIKGIYYGWNKDENIRLSSSSGGVFSAIAEKVLSTNGVVFGAVFDSKLGKVVHISSDEIDYRRQRKSKYVESDLRDTFSGARKLLDSNRLVLFSGTPCQIHGLRKYLDKSYDNLIACDFICHGVPPMKLLNEHMTFLEGKFKSKISDIDFRPKTFGWSSYTLKVNFQNNKKYIVPLQFEPYLDGFINKNIFLKKTCYTCKFRNNHASDIILADFWGIQTYKPEINDEKGMSIIFINSPKGQFIINDINDKLILFPLEEKYTSYCFTERDPIKYNLQKRSAFFEEYYRSGYKTAFRKFIKVGGLKAKLKFNIKGALQKIGVR